MKTQPAAASPLALGFMACNASAQQQGGFNPAALRSSGRRPMPSSARPSARRDTKTSRDIIRLNHHIAELVSNIEEYGEHLYWFTIMGDPSESGPWGWQLDGHHLLINYFGLGDQVVMTPTFMGSEPVEATSGQYAGVSVFEPEQDLGLEFMRSLPPDQQQAALIGAKEAPV
jgi:Protein of unknown function (DUF3500)